MGLCFFRVGFFEVVFLASVSAVNYDPVAEGYPKGFLTDCPGSWKPAVIKPKILKYLVMSVVGPGEVLNAKWTPYDYYHIGDLAKHPDIDFNKKTFLYFPGYAETMMVPYGRIVCEVYRKLGYNALILNLFDFSGRIYPAAARIMPRIGFHVAEMLVNLTNQGLDPKKLEMVGFSLGGQTMGFTAKHYRQMTGRNISSLTGLDASGPCFRHLSPDQRLDGSDADFVLGVTTNMNGFGTPVPYGHIMFYVNGGEYQPGGLEWLPCTLECSHMWAVTVWLAALNNPHTFIGVKCDTIQQARNKDCYDRNPMVTNTMDLYTDRSKPGIYYLPTSRRYPYFLGQRGLRLRQTHEKIAKLV